MQVAMIMGIVVIFAGVLFAFAGDMLSVQTVNNSVAMQRIYLHNAGGETYVSANVKNVGNQDATGAKLRVLLDTDPAAAGMQAFEAPVLPSPLGPGMTGSVHARIEYANGTAFSLRAGEEAAAVLEATAPDGSILAEPATARVR